MIDRHTHFLMEAAMCMWEYVVLNLNRGENDWTHYVEGVGYGQLRLEILEFAPKLIEDWKKVEDTYVLCFDWDFVPEWINTHLIFDQDGELVLRVEDKDGA